jgi:hypothetical protein
MSRRRLQLILFDFSNYETALLGIFLSSLLSSAIAIAIFEKQIILLEFMPQHLAYALISDKTSAGDFNLAAVGDWGCTANTHDTIGNIENKDPEIVLALGDFSYSNSPDCWFQEIAPFELKTKIAIGNHDDEESGSSELRTAYMTRFNLNQSFYSYDHGNVQILVMDTQLPSNVGSEQYDFAEEDLQSASTDDKTDWIIVMFHKPIYSSRAGHVLDESARTNFHPLFDKYGVDLVVQAHNHIYERTYPLKFNNAKPSEPIIDISNNSSNHYKDPSNPIFLVVGTGGRGLYDIKQRLPYSAYSTDENYGFLNIEIINSNNSNNSSNNNNNNNESILNAKFYANSESNNGKIIDEFTITK